MEDSQIIKTANTILAQLTVPLRVKTIEDVNTNMFVTLYEGLCGETIPDLVRPCKTEEDDIHNMQCVIDSLALDVLHTSLAHITGEDVVKGRRMSMVNLLDIFSGLLEYILDGIEKDESNSDGAAEVTKASDVIGQSVLNEALRPGLTNTTNRPTDNSDDNTEALIALGEVSSPTASPSSKKSKTSEEKREKRRLSRSVAPQVVSQPIASSSLQSINVPSSAESESDASVKPTAGKALAFSKVPAEYNSPKDTQAKDKHTPTGDATFIKPAVPPEKSVAHKLAEEILETGDSTRELMALGHSPAPKIRYRFKKPKESLDQRDVLNSTNNARQSKPLKRSRTAKRHVSFVSDRSIHNDDTSDDINSRLLSEPPYFQRKSHASCSKSDAHNLSSRLVDYFDKKETGGGDANRQRAVSQLHEELSPPTQSSEYQTALEKSASLYDRVTALRNAATQKLESMRCESENYVTAADNLSGATDLSTTQYYQPVSSSHRLSEYAKQLLNLIYFYELLICYVYTLFSAHVTFLCMFHMKGKEGSQDEGMLTPPSLTVTRNLAQSADYRSATTAPCRHQSNVADLRSEDRLRTSEDVDRYGYETAPTVSSLSENYTTAPKSAAYTPGEENSESYATATQGAPVTEEFNTAYSDYARSKGEELRARKLTEKRDHGGGIGDSAVRESLGNRASVLNKIHRKDQPKFGESKGRGGWVKLSERREKKVRFNRSGETKSKEKPETVVDAVRKTLDEEKWRDRVQQKLLAKQYKDDLTDMVEAHREQLEEEKDTARRQDKEFAASVIRLSEAYGDKPVRSRPVTAPKGFLLPKTRKIKKKKCSSQNKDAITEDVATDKPLDPADDNFLPNLMEEFPHLYLAPETIQKMWKNHRQQTAAVNKALEEDKRKSNKAQATIEDAEKRQSLLMKIMQKELEHTKRVKQMRDKENAEVENRRRERDVRVQSARVKKYYDDYAVRMKSSMLKNKTKEEQLFKRLFAEGLKVQKERMQTLRNYTREQREKRAHRAAAGRRVSRELLQGPVQHPGRERGPGT
ncbi:CEP95 [Bugula neritina]|uniref:CEP95 n=1 Tax=Bugula neritina TaxID=10212 RepID=A0A7J7IW59_BUGNE|nr:CEP95 [Bugula neritina]